MKIALRYGLLVTAVVVAWVLVVRVALGVGADSKVNLLGFILFSMTQIAAIFLGMRARKNELSGDLSFKEGLRTGVAISFVYAASACLFFAIESLLAGPKLLLSETGANAGPLWQVAAKAYAGLFLGSLFFGLFYSTIISFVLAKRRTE
ncbi:MAG: hypothetical protein QOD33_1116 [Pyrinomonadaceae bacterium]|jgi:hypothetical protein|nr:hypothetical protein [Pyrinomonadaceae bacterium]